MVFKHQKYDRILGLDLSTNSIAYSFFVRGKLVEYGEITMRGDTAHRNYLANQYGRELRRRLRPDFIMYESAVFMNSRKTVITLAEAYGSVVSSIAGPTTVVDSCVPVTWQSYIGNKALTKAEKTKIRMETPDKSASWYKEAERQYRKGRTMTWVENTFGVTAPTDNVSDAIAVGWYAQEKHGKTEET